MPTSDHDLLRATGKVVSRLVGERIALTANTEVGVAVYPALQSLQTWPVSNTVPMGSAIIMRVVAYKDTYMTLDTPVEHYTGHFIPAWFETHPHQQTEIALAPWNKTVRFKCAWNTNVQISWLIGA